MKAIVNTAPGKLDWQDRSTPAPAPGQVLVRTAVCGICATDLEMIKGWSRTGFPSVPGHEWSGTVHAVGTGVDASMLGRACVAENVLADGGEVGFEHPGGYGQFLVTEARNVRVLPAEFPLDQAALIEPLAVCVRGMNRLALRRRDSALVLGDGVIGLLMLALLRRQGIERVTLVGGRPARLAVGRELGASDVINYHHAGDQLQQQLLKGTSGFSNVIEASGSASSLALALAVARQGGRILVLGDYGHARADFPWNTLLHRELELVGSNASAGGWDQAVALAGSGELGLHRLISARMPASQFAEAIELTRNGLNVIKVLLDWREEPT